MNIETTHSESLGKLFEALAKAQSKIEAAVKDKSNPYFKSKYADLNSIWDACRGPLSENGLSVLQTVEGNRAEPFLVTWLGHASGEWIKSRLPLIIMKPDPQSMGSAITYARRYALSAIVGVSADEEDDDGEKAMNRAPKSEYELESKKLREEIFTNFGKEYTEESTDLIKEYLSKYAAHYKKTSQQVLKDYEDEEKFKKDFMTWKAKNYPNA